MRAVVFVDTSVLLNVLNAPGNRKPDGHTRDCSEMERLRQAGTTPILPMTALVEAGDAVAKVSGNNQDNGTQRYPRVVRATINGSAPWAFSGAALVGHSFKRMLSGADSIPDLTQLMPSRVGTGDAAIMQGVAQYRMNVHLPSGTSVRIWTHDEGLRAYAP
jgi:hypothetical protein